MIAFWFGLWSAAMLVLGAGLGAHFTERLGWRKRRRQADHVLTVLQSSVDALHAINESLPLMNGSIQDLSKRKPTVIVDWSMLTDAANGAGFMLVKSSPSQRQGQTH